MLLVPILYLVWFSHNKMEKLKKQICLAWQSLCPTTELETYLANAQVIFLIAGFSAKWHHINIFK